VADLKIDRLPVSIEPDTQSLKGNRRSQLRRRIVTGLLASGLPASRLKVQLYTPPAEEVVEAELCDVSPRGAGLITQNELPRGAIVMFSCGGQRIYGLVKYCYGCATGYNVGVKITDAVDEPQ
jgi:hypothetical protein